MTLTSITTGGQFGRETTKIQQSRSNTDFACPSNQEEDAGLEGTSSEAQVNLESGRDCHEDKYDEPTAQNPR
ncbi:hypothetical protein GCK72_001622 [Caenorhabditis remanei]|uniref:Uncharacterized protein n=1 Tax=Caenorhabditis remanei TaxID=31234 RepID=A0A6A5HQ80_CAERE|nr:hypothetical protein GCK72_001622 [Caenorhabditis remanei]KAF1769805.1 hypothetical protein GCK72_001622 [Caenorhabditis remanei]